MVDQDDKAGWTAGIAVGVMVFACIAVGVCLRALVLAYGWNRFAVVGLGAPSLAPAMAFGITVLVNVMITDRSKEPAEKAEPNILSVAAQAVAKPLFAWALLALVWEVARP